MTAVHFVVPDGVNDPARPSGGNSYDRQVGHQLGSLGWSVHEHAAPGSWPEPDQGARAALTRLMQRIPDDAVVLLDGLVASTAPEVLVPEAGRLRLVMLVHMPLGHRPGHAAAMEIRRRESMVLHAASAVVTTSQWSRRRLGELYQLPPDRVHVAEPGVEAAGLATGTTASGALLCVAAVTFEKGHDLLVHALRTVSELAWHCVCVGSLDRAPSFVSNLVRDACEGGLHNRLCLVGPQTGAELDRSYDAADLVVLPSRTETYGMVVTEALARGLPVVAADVGGVGEAMGHGPDGIRPGLLVPPDDARALAGALRRWLGDTELRGRLRRAAAVRRASLPGWSSTASILSDVLTWAAE